MRSGRSTPRQHLRTMISGGDRRSIAKSNRVRTLLQKDPNLISDLAGLANDPDWLLSMRAMDLLEKLAHEHADWVQPHKRLFIGPLADSDHVRVIVSDNGHGIRSELLPHVFDRFRQGERQGKESAAGLGLGLAVVREMVEAHHGSVVAHSAGEGLGSTFTVTLPLSTVGLHKATPAQPIVPATESLSIDVLVVDDEGDVRDLLAFTLVSRGARVQAVSSARQALEQIASHRFDVLLADLRMPDGDGYELIRMLRAREDERRLARLAAIAVTAYAAPSDRERAIAAGYDSHVAKPVDTEELIRAIARVIRTARV